MKKQRGLKRYYKNLVTQTNLPNIDFNNVDSWPMNEHIHFDRKGLGNKSFNSRKPHLDKLFRHFELLADKTENTTAPFQLYTVLLDFDSAGDALFLHKPNDNNSQFMFSIDSLSAQSTLKNKHLEDYINKLADYKKLYGLANQSFCLLYKKDIGNLF